MIEDATRPGHAIGTSKRRRSGRLSQEIPIILIGSDAEGTVFSEETKTVVLSRHGAGIVSYHKLVAEQEVTLRVKATNREVEVRVVGEIAQEEGRHTYGVAFVNERLEFWDVEFPAAPAWSEDRPSVLTLECGGCQGVVDVLNGDFEYDICAIHGGLPRFCDECGFLTVWRRPTGLAARPRPIQEPPERIVQEPEVTVSLAEWVEPVREKKAAAVGEALERRQRVRAKVNFMACVRTEQFGEEVVRCIDMSRGGVSFRGRNPYEKEMKIEIAVPYAAEVKGAPAFFVRGRIAHVRAMKDGETWQCGVEFLR